MEQEIEYICTGEEKLSEQQSWETHTPLTSYPERNGCFQGRQYDQMDQSALGGQTGLIIVKEKLNTVY